MLFAPDAGFEVEIRGEEYLILRERDVHAVASAAKTARPASTSESRSGVARRCSRRLRR